jgi:hypothetical protein
MPRGHWATQSRQGLARPEAWQLLGPYQRRPLVGAGCRSERGQEWSEAGRRRPPKVLLTRRVEAGDWSEEGTRRTRPGRTTQPGPCLLRCRMWRMARIGDHEASDRADRAARRIGELRERLARIRAGEPLTPDDASAAAEAAVTEQEEAATARHRATERYRSAASRHRKMAELLEAEGRRDEALEHLAEADRDDASANAKESE